MIDVLRGQATKARPESNESRRKVEPGTKDELSCRDLMVQVISRIEEKLPGRIRGLCVYRNGTSFVLGGTSQSYYAKQVAQHMAMDLLESHPLLNNIKVLPAK